VFSRAYRTLYVTAVSAGLAACSSDALAPGSGGPPIPPEPTPAVNTYYVDQAHPQAADANPGTASLPWLTLGRAAAAVQAGDWVIVKPGTYEERVSFPAGVSGTADAKIYFKAEPRRSVTMWGFDTDGVDYLRVEGFQITIPTSLTGWDEQFGVFIRSDYVEVVDNYLFDIQSTAITGYWGDENWTRGVYVGRNEVVRPQMGISIIGYDWFVERNEVERIIQYGDGDSDYSRFFGEGHYISANYFHGADPAEIGTAHVDCFQTFDNNGEYARDIIFDGNYCESFHQGVMAEALFYYNSQDIVFRNNIFNGGAIGGAWGIANEGLRNVVVVHNLFADLVYHGVGVRDGGSAVIRNNIFYNAGSNYWADGGTLTGDHNLIFDAADPIDPADYPDDLVNLDPQFVGAAARDYHLAAASPAIDAGAELGVRWDRDGRARPRGSAPDIGPYEYEP
jgi:hypothetical protein